jgi:hypothetical protein
LDADVAVLDRFLRNPVNFIVASQLVDGRHVRGINDGGSPPRSRACDSKSAEEAAEDVVDIVRTYLK